MPRRTRFDSWARARRSVRPRMRIMLQESRFSPDLTVSESVRLIGQLSKRGDNVARVLRLVEMAHKTNMLLSQLCGGEERRLDHRPDHPLPGSGPAARRSHGTQARRNPPRRGSGLRAHPDPARLHPVLPLTRRASATNGVHCGAGPVVPRQDIELASRPQAAARLGRRSRGRADRPVGSADQAGRRLPRDRGSFG